VRLVISSAWYPVCVATYLLRAARRMGHDVTCVGPSSGDTIPWEGGKTFPGCGITGTVNDPASAAAVARDTDLWIDVDGGWFAAADLAARRRALVVTDPHCASSDPAWTGDAARKYAGEVYVMQGPYRQAGDKWLPYAYDPEWFRPMDVPRTHDLTNLGCPYLDRHRLSAALVSCGLRVLGPGRTAIGRDHAALLCAAPLAVVWPMADDLPCRVFEALACGRMVVTRGVPDALALLSGPDSHPALARSVAFAYSLEDCADVVLQLVRNRTAEMAPLPNPAAVAAHTWDARLLQLIDGRSAP
jgi:hypothetical protein